MKGRLTHGSTVDSLQEVMSVNGNVCGWGSMGVQGHELKLGSEVPLQSHSNIGKFPIQKLLVKCSTVSV